MALRCDVCGKGPVAGKTISHSHRATNRRFLPNVQRMKVVLHGHVKHAKVCSRCVRSGKIVRPTGRALAAA